MSQESLFLWKVRTFSKKIIRFQNLFINRNSEIEFRVYMHYRCCWIFSVCPFWSSLAFIFMWLRPHRLSANHPLSFLHFDSHSVQRSLAPVVSDSLQPMNHRTPGLPCPLPLPEFTQTHVNRVSDAIAISSLCRSLLSAPIPLASGSKTSPQYCKVK